ncbi:MAG: adenosine monophosphate-protein transferase [Thermoprotei archaeon]|nr:MAG: adenosine monophosphate-protein transferase [Thermoprotei archaeon]
MSLKFEVVEITKPEGTNVIIGQAHFIKTTEDVYEALVSSVPGIKFGLAFCESSGKRLIRVEGNDEQLKKAAVENANKIGAGHIFVIILKDAWPINILNALKSVPEITTIHCASANPVQVVVAETQQGRGIVAVIDGLTPLGVETEEDLRERREFLRKIGYKLS